MQLNNELPNTLVFRRIAKKVFEEFEVNVAQTYTDMDRAWRNGNPKYQPKRKRYVTYELEVSNELASKIAFEINLHLHALGFTSHGANARIGKRGCNPNIKNDRTYIRGTCIKSSLKKEQ